MAILLNLVKTSDSCLSATTFYERTVNYDIIRDCFRHDDSSVSEQAVHPRIMQKVACFTQNVTYEL